MKPVHAILLLGACLRLLFFSVNYPMMDWRNDQRMTIPAMRILEGRGYTLMDGKGATAYRPPLYVLWLTGAYAIFGPKATFGPSLLQVAVSVLNVYLVWLLSKEIWKREIPANASAFLAAVHPYSLYHDPALYHTFLSTALILGGLTALLRGMDRRSGRCLALAGALFALCLLVTPVVMFFVGAAALLLLLKRRSLVPFFLAGVLAVWGPWAARNAVAYRAFTPLTTEAGLSLWVGNNPESASLMRNGKQERYAVPPSVRVNIPAQHVYCMTRPCASGVDEAGESREFAHAAWTWIGEHPASFVRLTAWRFLSIWSPFLTPDRPVRLWGVPPAAVRWGYALWNVAIFTLIGFGLVRLRSERRTDALVLTTALALLGTGACSVFLFFTKYRIPFEIVLLAVAGYGLTQLDACRKRRSR